MRKAKGVINYHAFTRFACEKAQLSPFLIHMYSKKDVGSPYYMKQVRRPIAGT